MPVIIRPQVALAYALVLLHPTAHLASAQDAARDTIAVPSEGLWMAKLRFGPDVRGRLLLFRDGREWRAEIAGHRVAAHLAADTITLALPDSLGSFLGRLSSDRRTVGGHWVQLAPSRAATPTRRPCSCARTARIGGPATWLRSTTS